MDKIIELGLKYLNECLYIDFKTGIPTWKKRPLSHFKNKRGMKTWNTKYSGKKAGSILKLKKQNTDYYIITINRKICRLHRVIYFMFHGYIIDGDKNMIDHIDRNGLNNSISNLRLVTRSENRNNCSVRKESKIPKNNTSGVKGISLDKKRNKWHAYITINKKRKHIGYYSNIKDAIEALNQAKIKYNIN